MGADSALNKEWLARRVGDPHQAIATVSAVSGGEATPFRHTGQNLAGDQEKSFFVRRSAAVRLEMMKVVACGERLKRRWI
jgi:hypothetical protein